jgi:anti-sigma factor RsiW
MNAPVKPSACEQHEHEIADLVDGLLSETDAYRLRSHLATCVGCRAWHAAYAATNEVLGSAWPKPALSAGFDATLKSRVQALQAANGRDARRAVADAERDALIANLRRYTGRNAVFGALAGALTAGVLMFFVKQLQHAAFVQSALLGTDKALVVGGIGVVITLAVVGWVLSRSAIVTPRFARW